MAVIIPASNVKTNSSWISHQSIVETVIDDIPNQGVVPGLIDIPGTGVVKIVFDGHTHNFNDYTNTVHAVYVRSTAATSEKSADLMADLAAYAIAAIATWIAQAVTDWGIDNIKAYVFDAVSATFLPIGEEVINQQGTNVTYDPLPSDVSKKFKVNTGRVGLRGGLSWGALNENMNGSDGEVVAGTLTILADLAEDIYQLYTGTDNVIYPGVWSKKNTNFGIYRSLSVNNIWDSQARRKFGVGG